MERSLGWPSSVLINTQGLCAHPQVVFWGASVGNLHSGWLPISWRACGGAFQAAEGGSSDGQAQ